MAKDKKTQKYSPVIISEKSIEFVLSGIPHEFYVLDHSGKERALRVTEVCGKKRPKK